MSYPNADISFPGLFGDWRFTLSPKLLDIGNGIYWYGVLIAAGLLIALWFCMKRAPRYGLTEDDVIDTVLWAIPFAIVGARVYYVLFYLDLFRSSDGSINWSSTYRIWDGGLAIYGGILAAFLTAWLVCRKKKLSFWAMTDCCVAGIFIGRYLFRFNDALTLGCVAGARTTTAALGAVEETIQSNVPSMGYTITYAIGNTLLIIWGVVIVLLIA